MSNPKTNPSAFDWDAAWMSHRNCLPHLRQKNALYFITLRLADSLPESRLNNLREARDIWLAANPTPHSDEQQAEYRRIWTGPIERLLDAGHGKCELKQSRCREILEATLRHDDGIEYQVADFVIMPNHVHVLVHVLPDFDLSTVMKAWKSVSCRQINRQLGRKGQLWMEEYFDHIVRNEFYWARFVEYIRKNPARLKSDWFTLGCGTLTREKT